MQTPQERLWSRVNKSTDDSCWEWSGPVNNKGYGGIGYYGHPIGVHVLAYILCKGWVPHNTDVCHKCDNPRCCNPAHLFLGSREENMADCIRKGRRSKLKLTAEKVCEIRRLYATGKYTQQDIASKFDVNQTLVSAVVRKTVWKHVR